MEPRKVMCTEDRTVEDYEADWRCSRGNVDLVTGEVLESRTSQEFAEDADVNRMVERFTRGHSVRMMSVSDAKYGDFTALAGDFMEAQTIVADIKSTFRQLPAKTRLEFDNSEERFVDFMGNPENEEEARRLLGAVLAPDGEEAAENASQADATAAAAVSEAPPVSVAAEALQEAE